MDLPIYRIADLLAQTPEFPMDEEEIQEKSVLYTFEGDSQPEFNIHNLGNGIWEVTGEKIEKIVAMTSFVSDDSFKRFALKMRNLGLDEALRVAGAENGDTIRILDFEFDWMD